MTLPASGAEALPSLASLKAAGRPIVMLTAYDFPSARVAEEAGVDVVLVGDSAAMTVLGYDTTRAIQLDELLMLTRAVRRAVTRVPVIGDLPFGCYEPSDALAVETARRFVSDAGCDAVKLEGAGPIVSRVRAIIAAGIPVIGHVGLLPQSVTSPDGYRARGRDVEQALAIIADADALAAAGCAALVVEAIPARLTALITRRIEIPVIGIGAGSFTDGQVLVYHDLLGLGEGRLPRFVRQYATARHTILDAVRRWAADVRGREFPSVDESYGIPEQALDEVEHRLRAIDAQRPA